MVSVLYLEINLMAVLLVLFIRFKTLGISKMVSQRNFSNAIDAQVVFFLSDTAAALIVLGALPFSRFGLMAAKTVYFFSTALMCYFWFIYFEHLQGSEFVKRRRYVWLSSALVWAEGLLLVVNAFTGVLFSVDAGNVYRRGPLFAVQYLLAYVYVLAASGHALIGVLTHRPGADRKTLIALSLFPVAPAGAGIVQFLYPQVPLACAALSMATLILYQNWLDAMIAVDPLTHLNNRKQLMYHYEQWQASADPTPLYVMLIDANKFKSINDTYGHIQGDAALCRIADALRQSCGGLARQANIARYGGDEFVVLVSAESPSVVDALTERIHDTLARLNEKARAPYALSVSVGVATARRGESLKDALDAADRRLYEAKKKA